MAKRFGRTLISRKSAIEYRYTQFLSGSDHADFAGDCLRPVFIPLTGMNDSRIAQSIAIGEALKDEPPFVDYHPIIGFHYVENLRAVEGVEVNVNNPPLHVDIAVRCRKCETCLKARAAMWRIRALTETKRAVRTWFGTLTFSPHERFLMMSSARLRLAAGSTDYDKLTDNEQFLELHRTIGPELTKWMKRVRKNSGSTLRFLLVAEAHKDGFPHYHCLVHEYAGVVRHKVLSTTWRHGFTQWKLVEDDRQAAYVCKYLSKSSLARVRASKDYGREAI